jgi:tripartite-type tricarboxylate transporter receptor subunit TctC
LPDLIGGQTQVAFTPLPLSVEFIRTGKLRALAVTTATRWPRLPDLPAMGEFVPGYDASGWIGIGAPKSTPTAIIEKLNSEINAVIADPNMKVRLIDLGIEPVPMTPAEFGKRIAADTEKWAKVIKFANIKPE